MSEFKPNYTHISRKRGVAKAKITNLFKKLSTLSESSNLTPPIFKGVEKDLTDLNVEIEDYNDKITDLLSDHDIMSFLN